MSELGSALQTASRSFALVIAEREKRFVLKFKDEGITLGEHGLAWTCEGVARMKSYSDIAGIRLRRMPTPGADTGQCRITFNDGATLNVMSWTPAGFPEEGRAKLYREFVAMLHRVLTPADAARIAFTSGFPGAGAGWQRKLGIGALIAAVLLFVVTPLVLVLIFGDPKGYGLATGGAIMTYGLYWQMRRSFALNAANAPQTYSRDQVPAALLP